MAARARIIGLTGSIGMGKTTVTRQLAILGAKTCNADVIVHRLLARGGKAVEAVAAKFPQSLKDGGIDRAMLGSIVFNNIAERRKLEAILHPLVAKEEARFARAEIRKGAKLIVLDIPLLFETGSDARCDFSLVVTAPTFVQKQRVLSRPGMTVEKFNHIRASQMPDRDKRRLADRVIPTGLGKGYSFRKTAAFLKEIL